jgi:hypothetical protein
MEFNALAHSLKMLPTIQEINEASTYTSSKTGGRFSTDSAQFQWDCCLICGNFIYRKNSCPEHIICRNKKHFRFNYEENIKAELDLQRRLIQIYQEDGDDVRHKTARRVHAFYAFKLSEDKIMTLNEHNNLLRSFGLDDLVLS